MINGVYYNLGGEGGIKINAPQITLTSPFDVSKGTPFYEYVDVESNFELEYVHGVGGYTFGVTFHPDNKQVLIGHQSSPNLTLLNKTEVGWMEKQLDFEIWLSGTCYAMDYSKDGSQLVVTHAGSPRITVFYMSEEGWIKYPALEAINSVINDVVFSPNGQSIAVVGDSGRRIWVYNKINDAWILDKNISLDLNSGGYGVAFSNDGNILVAAGGSSGGIIMWMKMNGEWEKMPALENINIAGRDVVFTPDGLYMIVVHYDGILIFQNDNNIWSESFELPPLSGEGKKISIDQNGSQFLATDILSLYKKTGHGWDKGYPPPSPPSNITGLSLSPDGMQAVIAGGNSSTNVKVYKKNDDVMSYSRTILPNKYTPYIHISTHNAKEGEELITYKIRITL